MSLAVNIVDLAVQTATREGARRIATVELEIGPLAGVMAEALSFCFEAASRNTLARGATLLIRTAKTFGHCLSCGGESEIHGFGDQCPQCGGFLGHPLGGDEMRIRAITVDEETSEQSEA